MLLFPCWDKLSWSLDHDGVSYALFAAVSTRFPRVILTLTVSQSQLEECIPFSTVGLFLSFVCCSLRHQCHTPYT